LLALLRELTVVAKTVTLEVIVGTQQRSDDDDPPLQLRLCEEDWMALIQGMRLNL
jgi:hypothetical protein